MKRTTVTVSDGYRVFEEKFLYDFDSVCKSLKETDLKEISSVAIRNDKIEILKKQWCCPVCGNKQYIKRKSKISAACIEDKIVCPNLFYFPNVLNAECGEGKKPIYICEHCGSAAHAENKLYNFAVSCQNMTIKTELEINDIEGILNTEMLDGDITHLIHAMPVFECLYLDLNEGGVTLQIEDAKGGIFAKTNDLNKIQALKSTCFFELLFHYSALKSLIIKAFSEVWANCDFPFTAEDLNLELLFCIVKFINYPFSDFYYCVPYDETNINLFPSFQDISKKMHRYDDLPALFSSSGLPKAKSLKRYLFTNPEYFFYLEELKKLWQRIKDINLFMTVMKSKWIFYFLSQIHTYGKVFAYFDAFIKHNSVKSFCNFIVRHPERLISNAIGYLSISDENKMYYEPIYVNKNFKRYNEKFFNIPMARMNERIKSCSIDGYDFTVLKSKCEYLQTGKQLENCLVRWDCTDNPVVAVKKNNKIVGAVEIGENRVIQANGYDNTRIDNTDFYPAFLKFCKKYRLNPVPIFNI